jgi:8-oxo-dGTP pyrophosphatase MutT (NUDIX family)
MKKVVAGICIKYIDNTPYVLLGLKPDGHWEFPGGKVEVGEIDKQALEREWIEELDAIVKVGEFYTSVQEHPYDVWFYNVELTKDDNDGSGAKAKEHIDVTWFDISNLDSIPMADTNYIVANLLIQDYL